jgi:hypothetical protein
MDLSFLKVLTNRIGEWVPMHVMIGKDDEDLSERDIHTMLTFMNDYDNIFIKFYKGTLWFSYNDEEPPKNQVMYDNPYNNVELILRSLESWDCINVPELNYCEIFDEDTGDAWVHALARRGYTNFLGKILTYNNKYSLCLNKAHQTPYDVSSRTATRNLLLTVMTDAIQNKKYELRKELETIKHQMSLLQDKAKRFEQDIVGLIEIMPKTGFWEQSSFSKICMGFFGGIFLMLRLLPR